jgi:glutamine amidotransferase
MKNILIGLINYGVGNLQSIKNAIYFIDPKINIKIISDPYKLKEVSKIILPGVGAFGDAIKKIKERSFDEAIYEEVKKGKYLLGICLGMQLLGSRSYEYGLHIGLDLIKGNILYFKKVIDNLKIPHVGWNDVEFLCDNKILKHISNYSDFYFIHSYFFQVDNKSNILGITEYGIKFPSIINHDNVYGVQFHPEKSQRVGLKLLENFISL